MTASSDPFEHLARALHPLHSPPAGPGWNRADIFDLLPPEFPLRPAAVLVALVERADGPRVLLTRRTDALRHHGGQVAFPGGRIEDSDADPVAAALREADEEVGLAPALARLPFVLDPANVGEQEVEWQGRRRRLLEFRWEGHRIWGATASMLVNFRQRLEQAR